MKVKFNKYERVAGIFVLLALSGSIGATVGVAIKKNWFSPKTDYVAYFESGEGLHSGTSVQMSGLRVGSVDSVELTSDQKVMVKFRMLQQFSNRVRQDSNVQMIRPFVIGEKVLDVSAGSKESPIVNPGGEILARASMDIMDLLSGKKLGQFLGSVEGLVSNMKELGEAFSNPERTKAMIKMFDRLSPLIENMNKMSKEVTQATRTANRNKRLENLLTHLTGMTSEMTIVLSEFKKVSPNSGQDLGRMVKSLVEITDQLKLLTPAITTVAPELPKASKRALQAIDEAVVTLKAIQRSFFLRGHAEDVKEEESKKQRLPANKDD